MNKTRPSINDPRHPKWLHPSRMLAVLLVVALVATIAAIRPRPAAGQVAQLPNWADVPCDANYREAVDWAHHVGLMLGNMVHGDQLASPTRPLTRAEAVVILHRLVGLPSESRPHPFADLSDPGLGFARDAVSWAFERGIVKGRTATQFAPRADISRAAFVTMLHRLVGSPPVPGETLDTFSDMSAADVAWAAPQVGWAAHEGISRGSQGRFSPRAPVNRAETALFLRRFAPQVHIDTIYPPRPDPTSGCVTPAPPAPIPAPTPTPTPTLGDGRFFVGSEIGPGRYVGGADQCYFARLSGLSGEFDDIISNAFGTVRAVVDIAPTDLAFESSDCAGWALYAPPPTPATSFGEGMWVVGTDIVPGTYQAAGTDSCYWARLNSFAGDFDAIIANDLGTGRQLAEISINDVGFESSHCGDWTRIG